MYLNDWSEKSDLVRDFDLLDLDFVDVLLASYSYKNYSGDAFVLYRDTRDDKLYEVHGSHCSCYGLEGQWNPELCDLQSLRHRLTAGYLGKDDAWSGNVFANELAEVLKGLEA